MRGTPAHKISRRDDSAVWNVFGMTGGVEATLFSRRGVDLGQFPMPMGMPSSHVIGIRQYRGLGAVVEAV